MPARIAVLQWIVVHIRVTVEFLRVAGSPRRRGVLPLLPAHLEPEALGVLARQTRPKARFVEIHGERTVRCVRHNAVGLKEATQRGIVVASIIEQQARARIFALAGVAYFGAADANVTFYAVNVSSC